jgi:isopentenyl phosphate kinase
MRTELLAYLTTATSTLAVKAVSELPWNTAGEPLYLKNMKKFYLDQEEIKETTLIPLIYGDDVFQNDLTVRGYFVVDAKNQPAGLSTAITTILSAKDKIGVTNFGAESDYTTEIQDDVIIYTVEYRLNTIKQ